MSEQIPKHLQRVVLQPDQCDRPLVNLSYEQQHYLQRVLRLGVDSQFIALDGKGHWWLAQLQTDLSTALLLEEIVANPELSIPITIAAAMPKGSHMEDVIKQTTELGVSKIIPLWSDRTIIKTGIAIGKQKLERWQRIAQEASELSRRTFVPEVIEPMNFKDCMQISYQQKYICVTSTNSPHMLGHCLSMKESWKSKPSQGILILIGPEGGWTDRETKLALAQNCQPVSLGDRILAATTAPVVALAIVSAVLQIHDCS